MKICVHSWKSYLFNLFSAFLWLLLVPGELTAPLCSCAQLQGPRVPLPQLRRCAWTPVTLSRDCWDARLFTLRGLQRIIINLVFGRRWCERMLCGQCHDVAMHFPGINPKLWALSCSLRSKLWLYFLQFFSVS